MAASNPTAATAARIGPTLPAPGMPARAPRERALVRAATGAGRLLLEDARVCGSALDALLAGLVLAFVVAVGLNGPAQFLGIPRTWEVLLAGAGALAVVGLGGLAGRLVAILVALVGRRLDAALRRLPMVRRAPARIRRIISWPFELVAGLPLGWLGAFAAAMAVVLLAGDGGVLGVLLPASAMGPYVLLAGGVFALIGAATAVVRPAIELPAAAASHHVWRSRLRRGIAVLLASTAVAATGGGSALLLSSGSTAALVAADARLDGTATASTPTTLADPGLPGAFEVRAFSYGSGTDARRPAFGREVLLTTPTVDASKVLSKLGSGADEARDWFWGFGTDAIPLNGLAWMPVGAGPFPLVLVVHGNHAMGDFSEFGYEYLGRHLASRGFITVSVDEDFLNGSWADDWKGSEQLVRAWLLLLHLDQWRTWHEQLTSQFHGMVDLARVALIGHSRGGEAASIAAMLATRPSAPSSLIAPWPLGLHVKAVVGIAPSDGQFGSPVVLKDVDLLELQGGHDADVRGWIGIQQFSRTTVTGDAFKAALWAYRANHGQFSTVWGRSDWGPSGGAQLNLAPLLDPAAQQDVARTAIGAFLEASLHRNAGYRGLFERPMTGREWLPEDIYLVRSVDGNVEPLTLSDPMQPADGLSVTADGFVSQRSSALPLRAIQASQGTRGVELRWDAGGGEASWRLAGLDSRLAALAGPELHLSMANGTEPAPGAGVLDPGVELSTSDGVSVTLPLSRWGALPPPLTVQLSKSGVIDALGGIDLSVSAPVEHVLQTYAIPFADYAAADAAFRPERVTSVRLVVDRASAGAIWLAEVGLADGCAVSSAAERCPSG
jgi:Chlorophyllase enzyme